ncbi:Copia protein [Gossypium australe]|uniref:Copia protein n=1 Tax=Gossypium australe TaxID=47621 RepID=A0A5B6VCE7_9ROSI|nr:Copia protein [Gossypium australe]
MMKDFGIDLKMVIVWCDDTISINISKNPVQHSRTKHIDIRHHFVRELTENGDVELKVISTQDQLIELFIKPLDTTRFEDFRSSISVCQKNMKRFRKELKVKKKNQPMPQKKSDTLIDALIFQVKSETRVTKNVPIDNIFEEIPNDIVVTKATI